MPAAMESDVDSADSDAIAIATELFEEPTTLATLPPELLSTIFRLCVDSFFVLRSDGTLALPPIACTCATFRATLLQLPACTVRLADLRRNQGIDNLQARFQAGIGSGPGWQEALQSRGRTCGSTLHATALDCYRCDVTADALIACAKSCELHAQPLRGLALRKCHSVTTRSIGDVLLASRRLSCLVLSGLELTERALKALAGLAELQVLGLTECDFRLDQLLLALPRLQTLRCLLLGGANLLHPSGGNEHGILSLNSPLMPTVAPAGHFAPGGLGGRRPVDDVEHCLLPRLQLLEVTSLEHSARKALEGLAPNALVLDLRLNSPARPLATGLARVTALLSTACGEDTRCLAESALHACLSARSAGFHESALHIAAIKGDAATAALLLEYGAAADLKDSKGCTPLSRAVFEGRSDVVRLLLSTGNVDLDRCNHGMESPCYLAALRGHVDCLELLLTMPRPSSLRDVSFHDGYTPLHAAVIARSIECVRLLLGHGFNPSAQNKFLQTALHIAASLEVRAGCTAPVKAAEMLLAAGCDASLKDERGHDAAHVAKRKGQEHIVSLIAAAEPQKAVTSLSAENQPNRGGRDSGGVGRGRRRRGGRGNRSVHRPHASGQEAMGTHAATPSSELLPVS